MPTYQWFNLSADADIPAADGMAAVRLSDGTIMLQGGITNQTISTLCKGHEDNPGGISIHDTLPIAGRHCHIGFPGPLTWPTINGVAFADRAFFAGGDAISPVYQPQLYSVNAAGNDFRVHETNMLGLDCILMFGFVYWDPVEEKHYFGYGGGQQMQSHSGVPKLMINLYRWHPASGPELVIEGVPWGHRGLYSNLLPELNGKHFFLGGAAYEDGPWPREHRRDVVSFGDDFFPKTRLARTSLLNRAWHNTLTWDDKLWMMLGCNFALGTGANADLNDVHYSEDEGETWVAGPTFTGTKRHAASALVTSHGPIVLGGSHAFWSPGTAKQIMRLEKVGAIHDGAPPNSWTGWAGEPMVSADLYDSLPNGAVIASVGWNLSRPYSNIYPMLVRENGGNNVTVVYKGPMVSHGGGGYQNFSVGNFQIPTDGATYRKAFQHSLPAAPAEPFSSSGGRGSFVGTPALNDSFTYGLYTDGTICTRWAEAP